MFISPGIDHHMLVTVEFTGWMLASMIVYHMPTARHTSMNLYILLAPDKNSLIIIRPECQTSEACVGREFSDGHDAL